MLGSLLLTIVETLGSLLSGVLLARFVMQWQRISFRNPLGQFVVATTDWLVLPLRRFIPGLGGLDLASLLPAWVVQVVVVFVALAVRGVLGSADPLGLLVVMWGVGLLETVKAALYLLMGVVLMHRFDPAVVGRFGAACRKWQRGSRNQREAAEEKA